MILPMPPGEYAPGVESERNRTIELADRQNRKLNNDVELRNERLIMHSPDGSRWAITVDDAGVIAAVAL